MKKIIIISILFIVGCEESTPTESSVHPLVGIWEAIEGTTSDGVTKVAK